MKKISLTDNPILYWSLFLGVIIWFCVIASFHPKQVRKEQETKRVRKEIASLITNMQGIYEQVGGRGTGFVLDADFSNADKYDKAELLNKIISLGYNPIHSDLRNKYRSVTLCKDRSSLDISSGDKKLLIYFGYSDAKCIEHKSLSETLK